MDKQLNNLLYSTSQHDDDDGGNFDEQLDYVQGKFSEHFPDQYMDEDGAMQLGNGQSIEYDDDQQWNNQQQAQHCFREVAGSSEQFSRSLSIHRHDLLQSRGMHDNSINLENINIHNIIQGKKKEEQKLNLVIDAQIQELMKEKNKHLAIIQGQKKQIRNLEMSITELQEKNAELQDDNKRAYCNLVKKDDLFATLRQSFKDCSNAISQKEAEIYELYTLKKQLEVQNQRLNKIISMYSQDDKNLLDFRSMNVKKLSERSISPLKDFSDKQLQKLKRQKINLQAEYDFLDNKFQEQGQRLKNIEEELKKKISMKDEKIKQLSQTLEKVREETRKTTQSSIKSLKQKIDKAERSLKDRDEKIKMIESSLRQNNNLIKKKQEKIKELLGEIEQKTKKMNELKDQLTQQIGKNHIEEKLQKQREKQIDKLETQVKSLKQEEKKLSQKILTMEKPSNIEQKLRKQSQNLKNRNQSLQKEVKNLTEDINNFEKQAIEKDDKIKELQKKYEDANKKVQQLQNTLSSSNSPTLSRKKNSRNQQREITELKEVISKLTKQNNQLKKTAESNQQKLNKLFIMQSRMQQQAFEQEQNFINENDFTQQQHISALQEQLQFKDLQIQDLKSSHQTEIKRLGEEIKTLESLLDQREEDLTFKQKSIQFLHQKFIDLEKQNTELRAGKQILHSSFYDQSDGQIKTYQSSSSRKFLQKKISTLESAIQQKQAIISKLFNSQDKDRQTSSLRFENNKLRSRLKQLTEIVLNTQNSQNCKIAPQSLSQDQTIQFLEKTLKRILKSADILTILAKRTEFKTLVYHLYKILEKNSGNSYNHNSHTSIGSYAANNYRK